MQFHFFSLSHPKGVIWGIENFWTSLYICIYICFHFYSYRCVCLGLKGDEKYRCSETGYRIPLKCIESEDSVKSSKKTDSQNSQSTQDSSSTSVNESQAYITYRSCIPSTTEDKLSILSFEVINICIHNFYLQLFISFAW